MIRKSGGVSGLFALLFFAHSELALASDTHESVAASYVANIFSGIEDSKPTAQYCFARGFYNYNVKKDYDEAIKYMLLAADAGVSDAYFFLGLMSDETNAKIRNEDGIYYYKIAAHHDHEVAQIKVGVSLFNEGEIGQAMYYFQMAEKKNNAEAQMYLGFFSAMGLHCIRDDKRAFNYFLSAAKQEHPEAQFNLASFYKDGRGTEKNLLSALEYYHVAKINGIGPAIAEFEALELRLRDELNNEYKKLRKNYFYLQSEKDFLERYSVTKFRRHSLPDRIHKKPQVMQRAKRMSFCNEVDAIFFLKYIIDWLKEENVQCAEKIQALKKR